MEPNLLSPTNTYTNSQPIFLKRKPLIAVIIITLLFFSSLAIGIILKKPTVKTEKTETSAPGLPVYPNSEIVNKFPTGDLKELEKEVLTEVRTVDQPLLEVIDWYTQSLTKSGWTIQAKRQLSKSKYLLVTRKEKQISYITISQKSQEESTQISILNP